MFELIDVWTEGSDEEEYAAMMWKLIHSVFDNTETLDHHFLDGSAASKEKCEAIAFKDKGEVPLLVEGAVPQLIAEYRNRFPPVGHESRKRELRRGKYSAGEVHVSNVADPAQLKSNDLPSPLSLSLSPSLSPTNL